MNAEVLPTGTQNTKTLQTFKSLTNVYLIKRMKSQQSQMTAWKTLMKEKESEITVRYSMACRKFIGHPEKT